MRRRTCCLHSYIKGNNEFPDVTMASLFQPKAQSLLRDKRQSTRTYGYWYGYITALRVRKRCICPMKIHCVISTAQSERYLHVPYFKTCIKGLRHKCLVDFMNNHANYATSIFAMKREKLFVKKKNRNS